MCFLLLAAGLNFESSSMPGVPLKSMFYILTGLLRSSLALASCCFAAASLALFVSAVSGPYIGYQMPTHPVNGKTKPATQVSRNLRRSATREGTRQR